MENPELNKSAIPISIIIPSYNSYTTIERCLNSVFNQKTNLIYEVIVADSSTDNTPELIKKIFPGVKLIHSKTRMFSGKARNEGIKAAKGSIIVCLDSDCIVADEDWLNKIYTAQKTQDVVGGSVLNANPWSIFGWGIFFMEFSEFLPNKDRVVNALLSYNVSCKREIFEKYGHFPEHSFLNEDLIFYSRLKEKLFLSSSIVVKHINRTNFFKILKHSFKLGFGSGLARKQVPSLEGHFLFKYPFLIPLLLFYRFLRAGYRTIRTRYFPLFIIMSPLTFVTLIPYTLGFMAAAFNKD